MSTLRYNTVFNFVDPSSAPASGRLRLEGMLSEEFARDHICFNDPCFNRFENLFCAFFPMSTKSATDSRCQTFGQTYIAYNSAIPGAGSVRGIPEEAEPTNRSFNSHTRCTLFPQSTRPIESCRAIPRARVARKFAGRISWRPRPIIGRATQR